MDLVHGPVPGYHVYLWCLAMAVSFAGVFWRRDFLLPAIVAKSVFLWGAAATHLRDVAGSANGSPNNAGPILHWDLLLPVGMVTLYRVHRRQAGAGRRAPG